MWNRFCEETVPRSQIVFSELKNQLFESIEMLKNDYLQESQKMFDAMFGKLSFINLSRANSSKAKQEINRHHIRRNSCQRDQERVEENLSNFLNTII